MADPVTIKTTPPDLQKRLEQYPAKLQQVMALTNKASLHVLWEKVLPYPARPKSRYIRTGTLGRSLGASQSGGSVGSPDVLKSSPMGGGYSGEFGSNVTYAADVIGDNTQKPVHQGIWWTMTTILNRALEKIVSIHAKAGEKMVRFLEGMSL